MSHRFNLRYFQYGPYKGAKLTGLSKYIGKFYWARRFYANIIKSLTPKKGKILEIGCGFGDQLIFLEHEYDVVGTDISNEAIDKAKNQLVRSKLIVLKAEKITDIKEKPFDTVIGNHILEHLKTSEKVIAQVYKVLKFGGHFFMVMPNPDSLGHRIKKEKWVGFRDPTHISLKRPQVWKQLLEKNGFKIVQMFGDGLWDSPYLPFIPSVIQRGFFGFPALIQALFSYPFIPTNLGESSVIIAQKVR